MALTWSLGPGLQRLALSVLVRGEPQELPASPPCLLQRGTASGVCATCVSPSSPVARAEKCAFLAQRALRGFGAQTARTCPPCSLFFPFQ